MVDSQTTEEESRTLYAGAIAWITNTGTSFSSRYVLAKSRKDALNLLREDAEAEYPHAARTEVHVSAAQISEYFLFRDTRIKEKKNDI